MSDSTKVCTKCGEEKARSSFSVASRNSDGLWGSCKSCQSTAGRAYRAANREKIAAYGRVYYADNREKRAAHYAENSEKIAAYRAVNRERASAYSRDWYAANREKRAAYYTENRERIQAYYAVYRVENREQQATYTRNHTARKKNNGGAHTAIDIQDQYSRQKGRCFYCETKVGKKYHVDHVMPLSKGGHNGPENLVVTCPLCNLKKNAAHPMDYAGIMF